MLRIDVCGDESALLALRGEWAELVEADPIATVYQTWELSYYAWRMLREQVQPRVLAVRGAGGQLLCVAPLGIERRRVGPFTIRRLGPIAPWQTSIFGFPARPDAAAEALQAINAWIWQCEGDWDELAIQPVRGDAGIARAKDWLARPGQRPVPLRRRSVARFVAIPAGTPSWRSFLSGKIGRNIEREGRGLEHHAGATMRMVRDGNDLEAPCRDLLELHARRWRGRGYERTVYHSAAAREAMIGLVREMARLGRARLHLLATPTRTIAATLVWEFRGISWAYRMAFDSEYARYSPGTIALAHAIGGAISAGHREFDFGYGEDAYKDHWATGEREVFTLEHVRARAKLALAAGWDRAVSTPAVRAVIRVVRGR